MKIKGILFDKDGTLFDFNRTWGIWFELVISELSKSDPELKFQLASACGYNLAEQRFVAGSIIVIATAQEVNEALLNCLPDHSLSEVDQVAQRHLQSLPNVPVCDLPPLLGGFRSAGLALGVATNDYLAGAEIQLKEARIRDQFDFVCGYDSGFGGKPGTGMIEAFCDVTGLHPVEIAVVGDSAHDLQAGRAAQAGLNVGVLTGPATASDLHPFADVVLQDISELNRVLNRVVSLG